MGRSGAAAGHVGYFHETALYGSDEEFLSIVAPFIVDGARAGEPTLVTLAKRNMMLVLDALGQLDGVTFLAGETRYRNPARTIQVYREAFAAHVADGAQQIRVVGDVPHTGVGVPWDSWARYEATVNHAYNEFPVWGLCPYDTRITPPAVLDEVVRTHQHVASTDGSHHPNPLYADPGDFLRQRHVRPDPVESSTPVIELVNPTPAAARSAVRSVLAGAAVDPAGADGLELAVSETLTNALIHGAGPATVRVWTPAPSKAVVAISDTGEGIAEPFAGLLPRQDGTPGGLGLWIAHQVCTDVSLRRDANGFTVVLTAGDLDV